ncbi:MAG: hypothetical protein ACREVK_11175 [Gammaproteobacteria bacterium]
MASPYCALGCFVVPLCPLKLPRHLIAMALVATSLGLLWPPAARTQEVIVNRSQAQGELSRNALRALFGMRLRAWPDGTAVRVFVLGDDSAAHKTFAKRVLQIFPHQLSRAWDRLVFSGTGQAPEVVQSPEEMLVKVASTPGAIGYVPGEVSDERVQRVEIPGS